MTSIHLTLKSFKPLLILLFLSFSGIIGTSSILIYLNQSVNVFIGLLMAVFIYFTYVINRYTDIKEDFANNIEKAVFFSSNRIYYTLGVGLMAISLLALIFMQKIHFYHLFIVAIGILYSYPYLPWVKRNQIIFTRIKDIPLLKNLSVAGLWGASYFLLPILFLNIEVTNIYPVLLLALALTVSTFANTLFSDCLDVEGDRFSKVATLPTLWGVPNCLKLLLGIHIIWFATVFGFYFSGSINTAHMVLISLFGLYPLTYILPYLAGKKFGALDILMECDLLLFSAMVVVIHYL